MAAKIKLQRVGAKNQPYFRVVVQDEGAPVSGRVIEILGRYHPLEEPTLFEVDFEKTQEWLKKGAQPTKKLRILLGKAGILSPVDLMALPKRKSKTEKPAEAKAEEKLAEVQESVGEVKSEVKTETTQPAEATKTKEEQK